MSEIFIFVSGFCRNININNIFIPLNNNIRVLIIIECSNTFLYLPYIYNLRYKIFRKDDLYYTNNILLDKNIYIY